MRNLILHQPAFLFYAGPDQGVHGLIHSVAQGESGKRLTRYRITLVPRLAYLQHATNQRIFQHKTVPQIITEVLKGHGIFTDSFRFQLREGGPERIYCTQYDETDLHFIQRLCEEEGIHYHFQHSPDGHQLIFGEDQTVFPKLTPTRFNQDSGMVADEPVIKRFNLRLQTRPSHVSRRDYNFEKPRLLMASQAQTEALPTLEDYDYPGRFMDRNRGQHLATRTLEAYRSDYRPAQGYSDQPTLVSGHFLALTEHPRADWNDLWLLTSVKHEGKQPQVLEENTTAPSSLGHPPSPLAGQAQRRTAEGWPEGRAPQGRVMGWGEGEPTDTFTHEINIATAAIERAHVRKLLENAQQALAAVLELGQYQQCIADHLSLDGFDYQAAMFFAVRLLASIATPAAQLDPLAFNGDIHDAVTGLSLHRSGRSSAQRLLTNIASNDRHPLHVMLWPTIEEEQLFTDYRAPSTEEPNQGDGCFRATTLACLEDHNPGDSDSETLDGMTLAALMKSGTLEDSFTLRWGGKQGMAVLSKINEILHGAVQAAENRLTEMASQAVDHHRAQAREQAAVDEDSEKQAQHRNTRGVRARTVNIRLHGMQGEHLRQTMPRAFESALFIRAGNVDHANTRDYYLFGLEDLPEVDPNAAAARIYGEYRDGSGRLLGTTNARSARKSGTPIVPDSGTYFAIPANSQTASVLKQLNQAINSEALASSALVAAQNEARQLKAPLQLATENLKRAREGVGYRALNSKPFSVMVVMMEAWNLQVAMNEVQRIALERGNSRIFFGTVNVAADLLIALEALASKVVGNQLPLLSLTQKEIIKIPNEMAVKLLGARLAKHVVSVVTVRMLGQVSAGLLFEGVSLSDAFHASRWSDSSVWGHYMIATGGLLSASAVLLAGSAILTPVALLAVALIIGGAFIVAIFSNTDFEDWLAGSVFSEEGGINKAMRNAAELVPFMNGSSHYLEEPDEAFYTLVGLFSGIIIQVERNPHHDPKVRIGTYSSADELVKRANTRITVSSNIMGLTAQLGKPDNMVRCCLVRKEISITPTPQGFSHQSRLRFLPDQSEPLLSHTIGETVSVYVSTPANTRQDSQGYQLFDEYHWEVRAQIQLKDDNKNTIWAFPAPGPKVPPVNSAQHTEPNFKKTKQILWADQESHGVTGTRI